VTEGMTGFVTGAPLQIVNSHTITQSMYQQVFTKFGLPRLLMVDVGSEFQATFEAVASLLHVRIVLLPPGLHHAQQCEKFDRLLNKVVLIMVQDRAEVSSWHTAYASVRYAWNAMPVDMTNVQRSIAAIDREFRFPLDHSLDDDSPINACMLYRQLKELCLPHRQSRGRTAGN
jgi:hypothetical protein